jgi:hypothetical protein
MRFRSDNRFQPVIEALAAIQRQSYDTLGAFFQNKRQSNAW